MSELSDTVATIDLNEPGSAWIVETGHIDCFVIEPNTIGEIGRRRPLFTVPVDGILIGVDLGDSTLLLSAMPSLGCRFRKLDQSPETPQIEGWAQRLLRATALQTPDLPERTGISDKLELAEGTRIAPDRQAAILTVADGIVQISGRGEWGAGDGPLLVLEPLWAEARTAAHIELRPFAGDPAADMALANLHRLFLRAVEDRLAEDLNDEQARLDLRSVRESDAVAQGLRQLAGATRRGRGVVVGGGGDAVSTTVNAVLHVLGEKGRVVPASAAGHVEQTLTAHGLRFRHILLRHGWKTHSAEPLIGYLGDAKHPVALLPGRTWRVVDADGERPLDAQTEAALSMQGLQVYRALPAARTDFRTFLTLGLRGGGLDFGRVLTLGLGAALAALAVPIAMGAIFDAIIPNADTHGLIAMIAVLVVMAVVSGAFAIGNAFALLRIEARFETNGSPALMDRMLSLPTTFFRAYNVGDLVDRLLGIQHARALIGASASQLLFGTAFALSSLVLLLSFGWGIGAVAFGLAATISVIDLLISRAQLRLTRQNVAVQGLLNSFVLKLIGGVAKLRGAAAERRAMAQWSGRFAALVGRTAKVRRLVALQRALSDSLPLIAAAILYAAVRGAGTHLSMGEVVAVAAAFGQLMAALLSLAHAASQLARAAPLIERASPLLDQTPESREHAIAIGRLDGDIALRNVSFRYKENGPLILDNLSLDIPAGAFVAFVGPSGSGKSTVLRLLLGFETPEAGEVLFDGLASESIEPRSLRSQIGVVLQNGQIFSGSILENILGPVTLGIEEAWVAARMVGLDADIEAMPMGMHTVLLDGGGAISGGQRQRILIARALVHRPRILLFDEATSALDNRIQAIVTETLTRLSITRVVIAHRLSTIEDVDTVFVVDRGRLVQQGGFRELLEAPGPFAELARRQISD